MKTRSQGWAVLPYNIKKIRDRYLVATQWGGWSDLDDREFRSLHTLSLDGDKTLLSKLRKNRIVVDEKNLEDFLNESRRLKTSLFYDVGLHIAVVTERCNFACQYCQTKKIAKPRDMDLKTATRVLAFIFACQNRAVRLEFQGGEPLLNWPVVEFLVKHCRRQNKLEKKDLTISLVSNLSLLDDSKLNFLIKNDVEFCTSLDGPARIHDANRMFSKGGGTHEATTRGIEKIKAAYRKQGIKKHVGALPTVTRRVLPFHKELIDEYVRLGLSSIHLRDLNKLGFAEKNWAAIGYTPQEFISFWKASVDYIISLNKTGTFFIEESVLFLLKKILRKEDPLYVDLDSPCGAGRSQLAYAPNGDAYTCDEARMIGDDTFKLGNILRSSFQDVMKHENLFYTSQASLLNLSDYNSPFCAWSGTCPVLNLHSQRNPIVKIRETSKHIITTAKLDYLFEKIMFDKAALEIFHNWLNLKETVHEKK